MVYRYLEGQVYCVRCGYKQASETWKDISGHPRCNDCSSRVRTRPRSSRLKQIMRSELEEREILRINVARETVDGKQIEVMEHVFEL